jgi:SAM-dependent methyltransferase
MNPRLLPRARLVDLIEGYYLVRILDALHQEGILQALAGRRSLSAIARERRLPIGFLTLLLEYAALRSDVINMSKGKNGVSFRMSPEYAHSLLPGHLLDQYVGAYGPCMDNLKALLHTPARGASLVNRRRHMAAFAQPNNGGGHGGHLEIIAILRELEITNLLDLGCGTAALLVNAARRNPRFSGLGLDASSAMVSAARRRVADAGLSRQIQIIQGDVFQLAKMTSRETRMRVQAITALSVANEFFGQDERDIGGFLVALRKVFPRRILILGDYYGCLGWKRRNKSRYQRSLIHDVAQLVSGQGIPPGNGQQWRDIYHRASCTLVKAFEGESDGIARFIHLVQL